MRARVARGRSGDARRGGARPSGDGWVPGGGALGVVGVWAACEGGTRIRPSVAGSLGGSLLGWAGSLGWAGALGCVASGFFLGGFFGGAAGVVVAGFDAVGC